jgi:hypothetical protein
VSPGFAIFQPPQKNRENIGITQLCDPAFAHDKYGQQQSSRNNRVISSNAPHNSAWYAGRKSKLSRSI